MKIEEWGWWDICFLKKKGNAFRMLKHQRKGRLKRFRLDWRMILEKMQSSCDVTLIQFAEDRSHWQTCGLRFQQPFMAVCAYMFVKLNHYKLPLAE